MKHITHEMRKKAFAMMNDMKNDDKVGYLSIAHYYDAHKNNFMRMMDYPIDRTFSLREDICTVKEYNAFMDYLLEEWLSIGVQSEHSPVIYVDDIERMVGICLKLRICCISGRPNADLHHVDKIGMGNDRTKVDHSNYRRMPLAREFHIECHDIGQEAFNDKYHVVGVYSPYHNGEKDEIDAHLRKGKKLEDLIFEDS